MITVPLKTHSFRFPDWTAESKKFRAELTGQVRRINV